MKAVTRDKEGHYIIIKVSILGRDIVAVLINVFVPKEENLKQILMNMKGETDSNTVIVGTLTPHLHQWKNHPDRKSVRIPWP